MKRVFVFLYTLCKITLYTSAQENLRTTIQTKVDDAFNSNSIPGIIAGVSINGKHSFFTAGFADKEKRIPFTPRTQFEIGSITKTFTAYLLEAVLQNKNILDTTSIIRFLPDSIAENKSVSSIQFIQLLNHTSGLPRLPDNLTSKGSSFQPYASYNTQDLYSYLRSAKIKKTDKDYYSNLGMGLAGVLAENISGKTYDVLLKKYINKPIRLKNTGIYANEEKIKAVGYFDKKIVPYWDMSILVGAGGIKSDATDVLRYLDYIGENATNSLISSILQKTVKIDSTTFVAKGWHTYEKNNETVCFWHNGGTYGFSTFCAFNPINKNGVIIVINSFGKNSIADQLGFTIIDMLHHLK